MIERIINNILHTATKAKQSGRSSVLTQAVSALRGGVLVCADTDSEAKIYRLNKKIQTTHLMQDLTKFGDKPLLYDHFAVDVIGANLEQVRQQNLLALKIFTALIMAYRANKPIEIKLMAECEEWVMKHK